MSTVDKEELVQKAKLAEQSERYKMRLDLDKLLVWNFDGNHAITKLFCGLGTMIWHRP